MIFRFLREFWLNWKNFCSDDTLFLKQCFLPSFSLMSWKMFVQTKLFKKLGFSIRKKIPDQHYGKIPDQEFKLWSTKYLKLKIRSKSWYIYNFFEPVSNNESSTSPFYATVIGYFDMLIFWYFDIFFNNWPRFSQRYFLNSDFQVAHMPSFHHIFICVKAKMWSHWQNLYWKSTSH